jgi:hypothetical protein
MSRVIVNVAIGKRFGTVYAKGQERLRNALAAMPTEYDSLHFYTNGYPIGCPLHCDVPFAFKAFAMKEAAGRGPRLLWCDSCIIPMRSLEPIWDRAAAYGVWLGKNGFKNSDWTAPEAYPHLFPGLPLDLARQQNSEIEHVVATAFALDLEHPNGRAFLAEYFRLASQTRAFCGDGRGPRGLAHRHDQTAASVIAWHLGIPLTEGPDIFSYLNGANEKTVLVADGDY